MFVDGIRPVDVSEDTTLGTCPDSCLVGTVTAADPAPANPSASASPKPIFKKVLLI